jgi:hypothetical protein
MLHWFCGYSIRGVSFLDSYMYIAINSCFDYICFKLVLDGVFNQ